jgi:hypothetical protein
MLPRHAIERRHGTRVGRRDGKPVLVGSLLVSTPAWVT